MPHRVAATTSRYSRVPLDLTSDIITRLLSLSFSPFPPPSRCMPVVDTGCLRQTILCVVLRKQMRRRERLGSTMIRHEQIRSEHQHSRLRRIRLIIHRGRKVRGKSSGLVIGRKRDRARPSKFLCRLPTNENTRARIAKLKNPLARKSTGVRGEKKNTCRIVDMKHRCIVSVQQPRAIVTKHRVGRL